MFAVPALNGRRLARRKRIPITVFVFAFGLFGFTTGSLGGYEPETAAVTESLVLRGDLKVHQGDPSLDFQRQGFRGREGALYSRTGIAQPVLEAPFYAAGYAVDTRLGGTTAREAALQLFNPLIAAVGAVALYLLLDALGASRRRSILVTVVFCVATMAWPYSKFGMDTLLMTVAIASVACATVMHARPTDLGMFSTGVLLGLMAAVKPYGVVLAAAIVPLCASAIRTREDRARRVLLLVGPVVAFGALVAWYNAYRTGSALDSLNYFAPDILGTPVNALGLWLSPGKGLVLYSPLVVAGLLAFPELHRRAPRPAVTLVALLVVGTLFIAASSQWGDETWGPRYLLPIAWIPLVALAFGRPTVRMRRATRVLVVAGVWVQLLAVFTGTGASIAAARQLSGLPLYTRNESGAVPNLLGQDPPRWIPRLSPLVTQTEFAAAALAETLVGEGFVVTYHPFEGPVRRLDLRHPSRLPEAGKIPSVWWAPPSGPVALVASLALLLLALRAGWALRADTRAESFAPEDRRPVS